MSTRPPATNRIAGSWRNPALWPVPLLSAVIVILWVANVRDSWTLPLLYQLIHYGSGLLGLVFIVFPAARSFIANGQPGVLMLGCGVLMSQIGAAVMPLAAGQSLNQGFAVYNTSVLLSALCHFTGASATSRYEIHLKRKAAWLAAAFAACMAVMGIVMWGAYTGRMPVFFIDGQGGTPVRNLVVGAAAILFILTAGLLRQADRREPSSFFFWYALGLVLLAIGLSGSMVIVVKDSPLQWVTRSTQVLGMVYMCIAVLVSARQSGAVILPLAAVGEALRENKFFAGIRQQTLSGWAMRYGMTIITVAAAMALWRIFSAWVGHNLPTYITFYPTVMIVALLAGFGPGLAATVLAGIAVGFWLLPPMGQFAITAPIDRLGLVVFTGMGLFMSAVAELYRQNRRKVADYERETALRESEEQIRALYLSMSEGLANHDIIHKNGQAVDYIVTEVNPAFERITGLDRSAAVGRRASELYGTGTPPYLDVYARVAEGGAPERFETSFEPMKKHFAISVFSPGKGKFATVFSDITERKKAEDALRESEERYRRIIETANEGVITGDLDGKINFVNKKMSDLLGYPEESLIGIAGLDLMPADQKEKVLAARSKLADRTRIQIEVCFLRKDGSLLWTIGSYAPIFNDKGDHVGNLGMYTDITERKRMENDLQKKQIELQSLFNHSNAGLVLFDATPPYTVLAHNKYYQELFAEPFRTQGMVGKNVYEYAPAVEAQGVVAVFEQVVHTKKPIDLLDFPYDSHPPEKSWFNWHLAPVIHDGELVALASMSINITKQHAAEQALRESEARFRGTMEHMLEGCQILDRDWRYVYINDVAERHNRRPKTELIGKRYMDMWPGIESTHVFAVIRRCLEEQIAETLENEFNFPDGSIGWFDLIIQPVPEGVFILSMDVTERKKAEATLHEAKLQKGAAVYTRTLIEVSLDPLVTISAEGKITDANEAAVRATGVPKEDLIGTDFSGYFTEPEKADLGYRRVFDRSAVTDYPLTIRHKNGTLMDVLYNASVYKDDSGNVLGIFAAARDVTARKRVEEELAAHRQHLEELVAARTAELRTANADLNGSRRAALNLLKDTMEARHAAEAAEEALRRSAQDLLRSNKDLEQFAYVASHDLQEPLRAVGGFMGLLKKQYYDKLDDEAREYIDFSVDGAERMQNLIEGLLMFSRVGTKGVAFAPVDLKDSLDAALANLKALIEESNADVSYGPLPVVTADKSQMTQLLQNLIANAVKFHGTQRPVVSVGSLRKDGAWEIFVRDNGIGIEPQYYERIFLIFQRLHTRVQYKGTGIGLAVCKKIVERHGGTIRVESVPGNGSAFHFTIPDKGEHA